MLLVPSSCGSILGSNVRIVDSIVWDDTRIENGCALYNSVVCDRVVLHCNTRITSGSTSGRRHDVNSSATAASMVIGREVCLGPDVEIRDDIKLVSSPVIDEWGEASPGKSLKKT